MKGGPVKAAIEAIPLDEAELIEQCRRGERSAFEQFVRRYQDRVFNLCWRMCGNRADAEDLTQEAFVRAIQAIDRFDGRAGVYTWLFRIAVNLVLSDRRRAARRPTCSLEAAGAMTDASIDSARGRIAAVEATPAEQACDQETHRRVAQAVAELDEEHRSVVILRDMESFGYEEIAEILEVPIGTVKSRLHRARLALRDKLAPMLKPA